MILLTWCDRDVCRARVRSFCGCVCGDHDRGGGYHGYSGKKKRFFCRLTSILFKLIIKIFVYKKGDDHVLLSPLIQSAYLVVVGVVMMMLAQVGNVVVDMFVLLVGMLPIMKHDTNYG